MRSTARALALAFALVGSITLTYPTGSQSASAQLVEVRMGTLAPGSTVNSDFTEGAASVAGSLISANSNVLYLNNTDATNAWWVKLVCVGSSGVANVVTLTVGIDNGTSTPQVTGALGALTDTSGTYVRLAPSSSSTVYVTQAVSSILAPDTALALDVYLADNAAGDAYTITNANITIT